MPLATLSSRELVEGVESRFCIAAHPVQHVRAGTSPSHSPGDPPAIIAHSYAKVSHTMFSVEGDSRREGPIPAMFFPAK